MKKQTIVMTIEPSKRLSELCGFPYFIESRYSIKELQKQGVIDKNDIREMRLGKQISKTLPVDLGGK